MVVHMYTCILPLKFGTLNCEGYFQIYSILYNLISIYKIKLQPFNFIYRPMHTYVHMYGCMHLNESHGSYFFHVHIIYPQSNYVRRSCML